MKLNQFLAQWGQVSRRKAGELITSGQVFVNGKIIQDISFLVEPQKDKIRINKKYIRPLPQKKIYIMFHKATKVLSSTKDPKGRPTVVDFLPKTKERLFLVGRLDWDSEGLLLVTNDGDLTHKILSPQNKIPKTYVVRLKAQPKESHLKKLLKGVSTPVGRRKALYVKSFKKDVKIILNEGKKRQIRLMFQKIGFPVQKLKRVAIGRLKLNRLPKNHFVFLAEKDLKKLFFTPKELGFRRR